jgi:Flp pilus assembly protein TadG
MARDGGLAMRLFRAFQTDTQGVAAIEFALIGGVLCVAMLNVVDVAMYAYQQMQVANAAQMGAQAAWKTCDTTELPATTNCPGLSSAITAAIQSTSLGSKVSLTEGSPAEGYYCLNSSDSLEKVSEVSNKPSDCSAVGKSSLRPGDYIQVQVTYSYAPMFMDFTVASLLTTPIVRTAILRLG